MNKGFNKKHMILFIFIPILVLCAANGKDLPGKDKIDDQFIAGRIEFTGKNGKEGIVILEPQEKGYLLNKGVQLLVKRGNENIFLKITDTDGKYIRCVISDQSRGALLKEGETAYYSDSINSIAKYRDVKRIYIRLIRLYEDFIRSVESNDDPRILADSVIAFSGQLDMLIPEMKRISSKYPELTASSPDELKDESLKLDILQPRLKDAFFKIEMYSSDSSVKNARDELLKVLTKMNTR